jgi:hypothetical protein
MLTGFWWGNLKKINHLKDVDLGGGNNIKTNLKVTGRDGVG